jgi:hypothetical protein
LSRLSPKDLLKANQEFCGKDPVKPVATRLRRKPARGEQAKQVPEGVSILMEIEIVVRGPEHAKSRDGHQEKSPRLEQPSGVAKRANRILQVLENIKHEDEVEASARLVAGIERSHVDSGAVSPPGVDQIAVELDAPDLAELGQPVEKQAIPTAYIENGTPMTGRLTAPQLGQEQLLPSPPPPVFPIEVLINPP